MSATYNVCPSKIFFPGIFINREQKTYWIRRPPSLRNQSFSEHPEMRSSKKRVVWSQVTMLIIVYTLTDFWRSSEIETNYETKGWHRSLDETEKQHNNNNNKWMKFPYLPWVKIRKRRIYITWTDRLYMERFHIGLVHNRPPPPPPKKKNKKQKNAKIAKQMHELLEINRIWDFENNKSSPKI